MKKSLPFVLFLLFLSALSGYLMAQPSLIGKIGIALIYKEYRFLRTWWKGGLVVFSILFILFLLLGLVFQRLPKRKANPIFIGMVVLAVIGFYFTWSDFTYNTSHRWLKHRFHIGAYLFWLGWVCSSLFYLFRQKPGRLEPETSITQTI